MADETTTEVEARANARKVREGMVTSTGMDKTGRHRHDPQAPPPVQEDDAALDAAVRPRRGERPQRRRPGSRPGDPPALEAEALATRGSPGACEVIQQESRL